MHMPTPKQITILATVISVSLGIIVFGGKLASALSIPDRVDALERSYKTLADGQNDQSKRLDLMSVDIMGLRRETTDASRRCDNNFADIIKQLASIAGALVDVRDSARDNARDIMTVREKAANALEIGDEANRLARDSKMAVDNLKKP